MAKIKGSEIFSKGWRKLKGRKLKGAKIKGRRNLKGLRYKVGIKYSNLQISVRHNFSRCNNELYLEMVYETAMEKNVYPQSMPPVLFQEPATPMRGSI